MPDNCKNWTIKVICHTSKKLMTAIFNFLIPEMRRRIRGIMMSGRHFSLDSRMDLVHAEVLRGEGPNPTTESHNSAFQNNKVHFLCKRLSGHYFKRIYTDFRFSLEGMTSRVPYRR